MLVLSGCADLQQNLHQPGYLGKVLNSPAPPVATVEGGPSGVLLSGPYIPDVPDFAVDSVVGGGLKQWLTFEERRSLAMASERAAAAPTGQQVAWDSHDGANATTATGSAVPVGDVYRSLRGQICRDVRQSFDKNHEAHAQTVSLCRDSLTTGTTVWSVATVD